MKEYIDEVEYRRLVVAERIAERNAAREAQEAREREEGIDRSEEQIKAPQEPKRKRGRKPKKEKIEKPKREALPKKEKVAKQKREPLPKKRKPKSLSSKLRDIITKPEDREIVTYCQQCDRPMYNAGVYCSQSCSGKAHCRKINVPGRIRKTRAPGAGRKRSYIPAKRKCLKCGKDFEVPRQNQGQVYCDRFCSNRANREKIVSNKTAMLSVEVSANA